MQSLQTIITEKLKLHKDFTVKSYYASLEQGTEGPIYKIYKDSTDELDISPEDIKNIDDIVEEKIGRKK